MPPVLWYTASTSGSRDGGAGMGTSRVGAGVGRGSTVAGGSGAGVTIVHAPRRSKSNIRIALELGERTGIMSSPLVVILQVNEEWSNAPASAALAQRVLLC